MPTYILCSSLTAEGGQTLHTTPDRMIEVNREIAEFGCKLVGQYATLGIYDFVTIIEAPDNETIAHLSIDLSSRGTVKIMTLPAIAVSKQAARSGCYNSIHKLCSWDRSSSCGIENSAAQQKQEMRERSSFEKNKQLLRKHQSKWQRTK